MITYDEFQKALKIVHEYKIQLETHFKEVAKEVNSVGKFANVNKEMRLRDADCSVRLFNIIKSNGDKFGIDFNYETKIEELSKISMGKFFKCRNTGKGMLQELKELCFYAGVSLQP
jgi:DNA-directed RNA polymerase alpha subunit